MKKRWGFVLVFAALCAGAIVFFSESQEVSVSEPMNQAITQYIKERYQSSYRNSRDTGRFEVHKVYGAKRTFNIITVYLFSAYEEYDPDTFQTAGHRVPARVRLRLKNNHYQVISYKEPADGDNYAKSLNHLFPAEYRKQLSMDMGGVSELDNQINKEMKKWKDSNKKNSSGPS